MVFIVRLLGRVGVDEAGNESAEDAQDLPLIVVG
jgi:hypothetical protein